MQKLFDFTVRNIQGIVSILLGMYGLYASLFIHISQDNATLLIYD
jgi:hypothetical protein